MFRRSIAVTNRSAVIVSYARTPIGRISGALASKKATELGAVAVRAAVERAGITPDQVEEAILGNVISGGIGQAPARQAAMYGGLPTSVCCTTVNKVCASGMKAVMYAAQSIALGQADIVVAGGFESMTHAPHYMHSARAGTRLGHTQLVDGIIHDGLWDCYNNQHMGMCGEACAEEYGITREEQDAYAVQSYERSNAAIRDGVFKNEIVPVEVSAGRGKTAMVSEDEEPGASKTEKFASLRSAFKKDGTITAANASTLNDGAAAFVVMSEEKAKELGLKPLAKIIGYADAEQDPVKFTTAPSLAVPKALKHAGIDINDVHVHEINEAFSVVALANMKLQGIDASKVNIYGGAVSIGHPLGMSGARIIGNVINALNREDGMDIGMASICNGGGGASAIILQRCK